MSKKAFEIDISQFDELKELIIEYISIFASLLDKKNLRIKNIKFDSDSDKVLVEAVEIEEDSEEDTEWDFEWV
tara:strand:+ start:406 stop:624 length:219 start_codon:yes stop_codon:yes gene_type:complete